MTAEPAFKLVPKEDEVTREVATVETQAKELKVVDAASYIAAGELWKGIKALRAKVADTFDDIIKAAHLAHKKAVEKKKMHDGPLDAAERMVKQAMSVYDLEEEKKRQAEQRRLEEIARKAAEEQALMDAIAAEDEAKRNGATKEEAAQEAETVMAEPVYVPPVVLPKATPKMQGGPVYRTIWKFRIKDVNAIPRQYMVPNEVAIGGVIRSLKGQANIPGIEVYEERC
jgi:hypothetical protein